MKIAKGVPTRTYYISYRGTLIHVENNMRSALSRLPRDARGWRITYVMENDAQTSPRTAFQGARP